MNINITADGELRFIYADDLQPLLELGTPQVRRASHVEPTDDGQWTADLSPVAVPLASLRSASRFMSSSKKRFILRREKLHFSKKKAHFAKEFF